MGFGEGGIHEELGEAFYQIAHDNDNQVGAIFTGTGDTFLQDFDFSGFTGPVALTPSFWNQIYKEGKDLIHNLLEIEVPVIGAVNGNAFMLRAHRVVRHRARRGARAVRRQGALSAGSRSRRRRSNHMVDADWAESQSLFSADGAGTRRRRLAASSAWLPRYSRLRSSTTEPGSSRERSRRNRTSSAATRAPRSPRHQTPDA